jgi:c-di-GMP-binding flagellar brake protein YcgR
MEERRKFFRVKLGKLTSVVIQDGAYELIEEVAKSASAKIYVEDISTGGLSLKSKYELVQGTSLELTMPKIKTLDTTVLKCEVTRAEFEDGNYDYAAGLKFIPRNTDYLKQFVEAIKS